MRWQLRAVGRSLFTKLGQAPSCSATHGPNYNSDYSGALPASKMSARRIPAWNQSCNSAYESAPGTLKTPTRGCDGVSTCSRRSLKPPYAFSASRRN